MELPKSAIKKTEVRGSPLVVGTVHSPGSLRHALRLESGDVDLLELRVDHFADGWRKLLQSVDRLKFPFILTVRHPQEGGAASLSFRQRQELFRAFLPHAAFVDLELRSVHKFRELIEAAQQGGVRVIISDHHFKRLPREVVLGARAIAARQAGADIVKVAGVVNTPGEVARLLTLLPGDGRPMSVMGMGPLGKASRLLLACAGSVLNYGYLDRPQVSGQWPAVVLKERLREALGEE